MNVFLERKVDLSALVGDEGPLLDHADALPGHALSQPRLDLGVLEVEEVTRVVPDETVPLDGLAPPADLAVRFQHEVVVVALLGEGGGRCEAHNPGPDDQRADGLHARSWDVSWKRQPAGRRTLG